MTLSKLVVKNITRRRGRFVFTLLGITIGISSFVTFLSMGGSLKSEIYRETAALGANLIVIPKGSCGYEQLSVLVGDEMPTNITGDEVKKISAIKGLTAVPFLSQKTAINNKPVAVSGIEPSITLIFKGWQLARGSYFSSLDEPTAVVGAEAAKQFQLQPGSLVRIRGEQLAVKGVLKETGGRDDFTLFLPMATAQRLYKSIERVSYVAVRVDDLAKTDAYMEKIKESVSLGVVSDKQMLKSVLSIVGTVNITLQLIAAVSVLAAAFGIINTMLTATYERKREIGILQALGATRGKIFAMFMLESGFYGLMGGVVGVGVGLLVSILATPYISQNAFTSLVKGSGTGTMIDAGVIAVSILFSVAVAVVAGVYPAWRAARLTPVEAISYE
ncbi:ABC transporter, membrane protein [Geotalea daltonii FRC-32]|uniref:ABC transporter, membrane protein n=1 Tax=Geotalea daltonii (strain DSM 22248 / JCM 15807 / FRC-32) TaxID=316067 RepID=B9LZX4_GEODF|nr:ABC transporter permease [Geotalea daltonii]ACM18938.1 ABC transporter, membrane protein [Geotalea daltonii FRC-32]